MDRMVRTIREASLVDNSSDGNKIIFEIPDFDGSNDGNPVTKQYSYFNNEIKEGSVSLLKNVSYLSFSYRDNENEYIYPPDRDKVSGVKIDLEMDVDNDENPDIILGADVNLRNFNLNED